LRAAFIPTGEDWVFIEGDYSQLELRVAAHVSDDPNFTQVYIEGQDLHKKVLDLVFQRQDANHYERWLAKGMVFGAMYDRSPAAMVVGPEMDYLVNELGGEPWDLPRMEAFFSAFFGEFHELKKWQIAQKRDIYKTQILETEMGRLRRFPFIRANDHGAAGRQAINTPIQSLASDFNLDAMVRIHQRIEKMNRKAGKVLAHVVLIIHDSVAVEAHKSVKEKVKRIMQEEMEHPPIKTKVPFKVNISEAANWGATH
jgi:DNA polymerase-1